MEMVNCEPVGLDYFASSPVRIVSEVTVKASAAQAFAALEAAAAWPKWAPAITNVEWTSPRPFGLGTTRTVSMVGGMVAEESFITPRAESLSATERSRLARPPGSAAAA